MAPQSLSESPGDSREFYASRIATSDMSTGCRARPGTYQDTRGEPVSFDLIGSGIGLFL